MQTTDRSISPQVYARIGGLLYLIIIAAAVFAEAAVRNELIVSGDANATADKIRSFTFLWRSGIAANLFHLSCGFGLALIFYILLRPVSRELALLAVFFNLISIGLEAISKVYLQAALLPLGNAEYLRAFSPLRLPANSSR